MKTHSPINPDIELESFLTCVDYTVSRETFNLLLDKKSDLLVTFPQPNEKDLTKYYESDAYISHTDSSKTLIDKIYQFVKKYAIQNKVRLIRNLSLNNNKEIQVLDVGCGTGDFLVACKNNQMQVVGVEPNKNARSIAESKLKNAVFSTIYDLPESQKYDVITLWHVLEHVPDLEKYTIKLKELLKKDGILIIAVPNYKSFDAMYYKEFWAAYDVPRHLWHFSKKSISDLFQKVQLKVVSIKPMLFDSFYVSLLSEKYKTGKSNLFKAFFIGLKSNLLAKSSKEYSSHIYILKNKK